MARGEHYIAAVEEGKLRLYAETRVPGAPAARLVAVPREAHAREETCTPHRSFRVPPTVKVRPRRGRVSVDSHAARARDEAHGGLRRLAEELDAFLARRPAASWDFAGSPSLYSALVEALAPSNLRRLKRVLTKVPRSEYGIEAPREFAVAEEE
jgi:hypothetical protein